jgi:hypothetical protein
MKKGAIKKKVYHTRFNVLFFFAFLKIGLPSSENIRIGQLRKKFLYVIVHLYQSLVKDSVEEGVSVPLL